VGEDLLRVALHHPAHLREHKAAAVADEQLLAELSLQLPELGADGGRGDPQLARRARERASPRGDPEVVQVVVVQVLHLVLFSRTRAEHFHAVTNHRHPASNGHSQEAVMELVLRSTSVPLSEALREALRVRGGRHG
jgi:hypothetical protein